MPTHPPHHVVREGEIAIYHTGSRCVRRAWLCGQRSTDWYQLQLSSRVIEKLLEYLIFAVDIGNYNILSNHEHLLVRTRPDIAQTWSDEEVPGPIGMCRAKNGQPHRCIH